ncbi:mediator complex subunit 27-domain-containing protein [Phaeosphaeriaceae sp. PMI808]|nr:mediator complex subunit 27-domain-containing protein [Phaeosphaeriaceae sp. PMI808]
MATLGVTDQPAADWDEAQCAAALARLEEIQAMINNLRTAIPRIIEPMHRPPSSSTFKLYAKAITGSQNDIKDLQAQWRSPETQNMFEYTRKSLSANPDLTASKSTPAHGWIERERKERESKKKNRRNSVDENSAIFTGDEIARIVVDFHKTHPSIKLDTQEDNRMISTQFVSGSISMRFRVTIEREANGRHRLAVECTGTMEPFLSISRCIASRPQPNDLRSLLDMITAYKNVKGTSCAKCGKLLDDAILIPTARRSKQVVAKDETTKTVWEALHESCLA